jgi:hypothetical protein
MSDGFPTRRRERVNLCFFRQTSLFPTLSIFSAVIQSLKKLGRCDHCRKKIWDALIMK